MRVTVSPERGRKKTLDSQCCLRRKLNLAALGWPLINGSHRVLPPQLLLSSQRHSNLKAQGQVLSPTHVRWFSYHRKKGSNCFASESVRRNHRATGSTVHCSAEVEQDVCWWCLNPKAIRAPSLPRPLVRCAAAPVDFSTYDPQTVCLPWTYGAILAGVLCRGVASVLLLITRHGAGRGLLDFST